MKLTHLPVELLRYILGLKNNDHLDINTFITIRQGKTGLIKLTEIYRTLESELAMVEEGLESAIDLDVPLLYETSTHLLKAGGKRIRPLFVLLSGHFGQYDRNSLIKIAIALELIHMATLVHDDVIDDALTRRGEMTVKSKWDNKIAMYTGDYIFSKGLMIVTEFSVPSVHRMLSNAIYEMVKGEIEQIKDLYQTSISLREYFRRIKRKTALLISVSCELGAAVSGATPKTTALLRKFGYYVGMAFQITDDILDYVGTEKELGKPAGSDLKQGNITLPAIYALCHSERRAELHRWITLKQIEDNIGEIIAIIRNSGGIEYSRKMARRYLQKAKVCLNQLADIPAKESLLNITAFIEERNF